MVAADINSDGGGQILLSQWGVGAMVAPDINSDGGGKILLSQWGVARHSKNKQRERFSPLSFDAASRFMRLVFL
jgi:hypothetical protein